MSTEEAQRPAPWTPFYFEGNLGWGMIWTPKDWEFIKEQYKDQGIDLGRALQGYHSYKEPRFGFYSEYTGPKTLGEWAKEQGMTL